MKLFGKEEVNTGRQIEFDIAKAVCILGMVFVHCFEELAAEASASYYIFVVVLDCLFGAATFMVSMGLGIAYSWKNQPEKLIKRGLFIFAGGYLLNIARDTIPDLLISLFGIGTAYKALLWTVCVDIMQFAGLAMLLFGLLKKCRLSDLAIMGITVCMSLVGSFVRGVDTGHPFLNQLVGLFIGTVSPTVAEETFADFPLFNWFFFVAGGCAYAKLLRRCTDVRRYYSVALPVSGAVVGVYMLFAIPRGFGMMSGDLNLFYHMTLADSIICFCGAVFATSAYHFLARLLGGKAKKVITRISSNINRTYCIHWVILGWLTDVLLLAGSNGLNDGWTLLTGVLVFTVSNILAELYTRRTEKKPLTEGKRG